MKIWKFARAPERALDVACWSMMLLSGPHGQLGTVKGSGVHLKFKRTGLSMTAGWQRPGRVVLPDGGQEVCTGAREGSGFADAISWGAAACWSCCCDLDLMDSMVL